MGKSIFELGDKFGYESPWEENWVSEIKSLNEKRNQSRNKLLQNFNHSNEFLESIKQFCKSTLLYTKMGNSFPHWKKEGVDDKNIQSIPINFAQIQGESRAQAIHDEFGIVEIQLNENYKNRYNVPSFSQALFMEWGNAKNWKQLNKIINNPKNYTREDYIRNIEKLEFDVRLEIIKAYKSNQFDNPVYEKQDCIFDVQITDFEIYYNSPKLKEHKEKYGNYWDEDN